MQRVQPLIFLILSLAVSPLAFAGEISSTPVGSPTGVAISPANDFYWVTSFNTNSVVKFRVSDNSVVGTYPVGLNPTQVALTSSILSGSCGDTVWVTNYGSNTVTRLDANTGAVLGTFSVGSGPRGIVWDFDSMWIANSNSNTVTRLDAHSASAGRFMGTFGVGAAPYGLTFNRNDQTLWVANRNSNTVMKLSTSLNSPGTILGIFPVASQPQNVLWDGTNVWVSSYNSNTVTKLDGTTGTPLAVIANLPNGPSAMAVATGFTPPVLWVTCYASSFLLQISLNDAVLEAGFHAPANPYGFVLVPRGFAISSFTGNSVVLFSVP